jgi:hypothetical protein
MRTKKSFDIGHRLTSFVCVAVSALLLAPQCNAQAPPFVLHEAFVPYKNHSGPWYKESIDQFSGAGVCVLDYDLDGDWDLYFPNGYSPEAPDARNQLFRHDGNFVFVDVTDSAGVGDSGFAGGCAVADVDHDGDPDLYVTNQSPNVLFINNGDGTFRKSKEESGADHSGWNTSAVFADFNLDGLPDLYVCNYIEKSLSDLSARCLYFGVEVFCGPEGMPGAPDAIYRNVDGSHFIDETRNSGIFVRDTRGFSVIATDLDGDFLPEIRIANDATQDLLFKNLGGFRFEETGLLSGTAFAGSGMEQSGMGSTAGDFDRDGDIDFYVTHFQRDYNTLFENEGSMFFRDSTTARGLAVPTLGHLAWGSHFIDIDNDGALDLFVANGHIFPELDDHPEVGEPYRQQNQVFLGDGAGQFVEVSPTSDEPLRSSRGTAVVDLNDDGALDVVVNNMSDKTDLYEGRSSGNWIRFRFVGVESNRDGLGVLVTVKAGALEQRMELRVSDGFQGSNEPIIHCGLGLATEADVVTVAWPAGDKQVFRNLVSGKTYLIKEGVGILH